MLNAKLQLNFLIPLLCCHVLSTVVLSVSVGELRHVNACLLLQGVKPASYSKVSDPEIKEIIGECICHRWEER